MCNIFLLIQVIVNNAIKHNEYIFQCYFAITETIVKCYKRNNTKLVQHIHYIIGTLCFDRKTEMKAIGNFILTQTSKN